MKLFVACCAATCALLAPAAASSQSRGALLYDTHCIACHSEQVHWRQRRLVTDWSSLRAQVWRWQADAALGWNDDDVREVARYLNEEFYRLPDAETTSGRGGYALRMQRRPPSGMRAGRLPRSDEPQ